MIHFDNGGFQRIKADTIENQAWVVTLLSADNALL